MAKPAEFDTLSILGVDVDAVTLDEATAYICRRAAAGQPSGYVIKPYVEFIDRAYRRSELQALLNGAELSVPDGIALVWAAAYLYAGPHGLWRFIKTLSQIVLAPDHLKWPLTERAAGTNFTWPLLEAAAVSGLRVGLIGKSSPAEIEAVAEVIARRVPGLTVTMTLSGRDEASPYGQVSETWLAQTVQAVSASRADLVLVGLGFPLQETVCAHLAAQLPHGLFIGEGGTFDYDSFGGTRRKAPAVWQRLGLEWAWRLVLEPSRFKRQLAIPRFIWRVWRAR